MLLLTELKLNNFLSHEKTTISFRENEKLLLDGQSGAGKSAITEGILWTLYGRGRSENRSLVRRGCKAASASLKLTSGEIETLITRSVLATGKSTLTVTQKTGPQGQFLPIERVGIKEIQDWIENDLLKASYELFTNSVAYPQENENSFVKANAGKRKDLLLEIVRAGNLDEFYDKARNALTANAIESTSISTKIDALKLTIQESESLAKEYSTYEKERSAIDTSLMSLTVKEDSIKKQLDLAVSLLQKADGDRTVKALIESSIQRLNFDLLKNENLILEHTKIDIKKAEEDIKEAGILSKEITAIEKELQDNVANSNIRNAHLANRPVNPDYSKDIETMKERLKPLVKDTHACPAGDECPFTIPIRGQVRFLQEQIAEKEMMTEANKEALERWEQDLLGLPTVLDTSNLYNRMQEIRDRRDTLLQARDILLRYESFGLKEIEESNKVLNADLAKYQIDLEEVNKKLDTINKELKTLDSVKTNKELESVREELMKEKQKKDQILSNLTLAKQAQTVIEKSKLGLVELKKDLKKLSDDTESLELLKEAFSPRGVKAVIIDYLVPQLEDRINGVLSQMSEFRIRLDTQMPTADNEGVKEGLFITVLNDSKALLPFESYSGGERVKITVAISEALASLMTGVGFRIMDENIISLDSESTEAFVDVLSGLQDKFPQLILISHINSIKDMFAKKVTVVKVGGISKII